MSSSKARLLAGDLSDEPEEEDKKPSAKEMKRSKKDRKKSKSPDVAVAKASSKTVKKSSSRPKLEASSNPKKQKKRKDPHDKIRKLVESAVREKTWSIEFPDEATFAGMAKSIQNLVKLVAKAVKIYPKCLDVGSPLQVKEAVEYVMKHSLIDGIFYSLQTLVGLVTNFVNSAHGGVCVFSDDPNIDFLFRTVVGKIFSLVCFASELLIV